MGSWRSRSSAGKLVYSVANIARFLTAYVRQIAKEPVYLVGNSLGGLYSVRALLDEGAHYLRKDMMSEEECIEYGELFATIHPEKMRRIIVHPHELGAWMRRSAQSSRSSRSIARPHELA